MFLVKTQLQPYMLIDEHGLESVPDFKTLSKTIFF